MATPQVYKFMSVCTQSIGRDQTLAAAHKRMREHRIRHLPVLDAGVLVGVVTDRDLRFIETLREVDPEKVRVEEAMTPEPYFVPPTAPVKQVAAEMASNKYGCAVVMDGVKVVGIFTTTDALRALVAVLEAAEPAPRKRAHAKSGQKHA